MARPPIVDTDTIISVVDQFYLEKCRKDPEQLQASKIGKYMRSLGYQIQDYSIRRNAEVMKHINLIKSEQEKVSLKNIAVFVDTDIDAFLSTNNTRSKLKEAIRAKDNYYRELSRTAVYFSKENKKLQLEVNSLRRRVAELEGMLNKSSSESKSIKSDYSSCIMENKKLKYIIDTYVYPEIANELLKKQGLLVTTQSIINSEVLEGNIIEATDDITKVKNSVIKELFDVL